METFVLYPIRFLCIGTVVALMAGVRLRSWMTWGVAGVGLLAYMVAVFSSFNPCRASAALSTQN